MTTLTLANPATPTSASLSAQVVSAGPPDGKQPSAVEPTEKKPSRGPLSQQVAVRPSASNEVGPGPQQATGLRVAGSKPLQGGAEIWTGRSAKGLFAYLVTRTISVPLGRITEQALKLAQQGSTPLSRSEDFLGLARSLMSDPGLSGRVYPQGSIEIVADSPFWQAELTANYGAGRVPTFNTRVHDVMHAAGLAPDPRDGRTYTLPATKLGGQIAARIFFGERQGQAGVLNGMADANQLFPGAPKDFIDGFNGSKVGFIALRTVSGIQHAVTALATAGAGKVWGAKIQGRPVILNNTLYVPGTGPVSRLTSKLFNPLPSPQRPATVPNKGAPGALIPGAQKNPTPSANPVPTNYSVPKPTGGAVSRTSPGTAKAANSPYLARNPGGLGTGQTNGPSGASKPNDQSPAPLPATFKRGELAQIGGVKASHVPDGGNPTTTYHQATAQTRQHNSIRGSDVSLVYPVKHQGALSLHVIKNISPSEARALLTQLEKDGTLALKPETVFLQNGIGGRSSDGSMVTPEQDLQRREADIFFGKLTPQQVTDTAQAHTLTVNGKRGTALNPSQWNVVSRLYTQANDPQRGPVSLALVRLHTLQGPHGQKREMPVLETWADLTPAEARTLLNRAAGFNDKGQQVSRPTLMHPPGVSGKDAITATLKANGLSPEGLSQRERVTSRSQEQQRQKQFQLDQAKLQAAQVATSQLQQQPQEGPAGTPWTRRMADAGRNVLPLRPTQQKEIEAGAYNLANPDRAGAKAAQEKTQALHTRLQQALVQRVTQSLAPPDNLAPDLSGWSFKQMVPGASTELKFGAGSLWLPSQEITLVKPGETPRVFQATPRVEPATPGRPASIGFQISETSKPSNQDDAAQIQKEQLRKQQENQAKYVTQQQPPQQAQQGQQGLNPSTASIDYSRFGRTAVIGDFPDGSDPISKGTAALLASNLNGATPLVVVGDKYTPNIIGDMAPQGNNRTVFAKGLERYQDVRTVFYARTTDFADPDSVRDFVRFAYQLPAGARAMVATNQGQSFATFGHKLRPDVNWSGNSSYATFLGGRSADSTAQLAVSAVTDASKLANGTAGSNLARPLNEGDARFVSEAIGLPVPDGLVISAPFDVRGNLERSDFMQQYSRDPGAARASMLHAIADWNAGQSRVLAFATGNRPELRGTTFPTLMSNPTQLADLLGINPPASRINQAPPVTQSPSPDYLVLEKTAILGVTSKAGGGALAQLADQVPLVGVSRDNVQAQLPRGVMWSNRVPSDVKTVIVTAAVPWRKDPVTGAIIFDRKVLVEDNINVVLPYLDSIPRGATVNVVTNPSNTIAWVVQSLRPDLKVFGHEGTDVGRLDARHRDGMLFGLHSPFLVATDRNGNPDPVVPVAGNIYARGGYSATNTTGTWAVTEAVRARQGVPGNYAVALKPNDAAWLTQLARTHITGWEREIPTGLVITAPINPANGTLLRPQIEMLFQKLAADERAGVTYTALRPIQGSPNFDRVQLRPTQLLSEALQELFDERGYALEALQDIVREKHPGLRQVPIEQLLTDPANLLRLLQ